MAIISSKIFSATFPSQISIVHMLDCLILLQSSLYSFALYTYFFFLCVSFWIDFFACFLFFSSLNSLTFYSAVISMLIVANLLACFFQTAFLICRSTISTSFTFYNTLIIMTIFSSNFLKNINILK